MNPCVDTGSGAIELRRIAGDTSADTGSGDATLAGDLSAARTIDVDTGSCKVEIFGGPAFEFDLTTECRATGQA